MLTYAQFRAQYKQNLGDKKFNVPEFNKSWNKYKKDATKPVKATKPEKTEVKNDKKKSDKLVDGRAHSVSQKVTVSQKLEVAEQSESVMKAPLATAQTPSEPVPAPVGTAPVAQAPQGQLSEDAFDMYTHVAESIHQACANLIDLATEGRVKVTADKLTRLNECGAHVLKKYDKDGKLLEHAPEIAYVLTLADVASMIYVDVRRQKKNAAKPAVQAPHNAPSAPAH